MSVMNFRVKKKKNVVGKLDICNSLCQHWLLPMVEINLERHEIMDIGHLCPIVHYPHAAKCFSGLLTPLYRGCNGLRPSLNSQNCSDSSDTIFDEEPEETEDTHILSILGSSTVGLVDLF